MSTLHIILMAGMASWIISLPMVALFRWLSGSTRQREAEIDNDTIMRRLQAAQAVEPPGHEMEWI